MKKINMLLCLCLCLAACDSETTIPKPEPPFVIDPDEPIVNVRVDIPLTQTETQLVSSGNTFGYQLYEKVRDNSEGKNIVLSPLSVSLAFSMLNNGAAGISQQEIQNVLGFEDFEAKDINEYYRKMIEAAATIDPQVILESANSIWINEGFPVLPQFVAVNQDAFDAEIKNVNFGLPTTLEQINGWASEKTHGKIPTILDKIDPMTQMILMNALYFLGDWKYPFEKDNTHKESFTDISGENQEVDMMNQYVETLYMENDLFSAIELPYGNGAFYMQLVLPHENVTLKEIVNTLEQSFSPVSSSLRSTYANVSLKLPKFKVDYEIQLNEILEKLGMNSPFDPLKADFSAISDVPLFISLVKQKASIDVNERGAEAAAVTVIGMDVTSAGPGENRDFHIDRPFLFIIRELSSQAIFFIGEVNQL